MLHQLTTHSVQHLLDSLHTLLNKDVELETIVEPLPEGGEDQNIDVSLLPPLKTPSVSIVTHSITHSLARSLTHSLTHPPTHSLTHPPTHPLTHPPTHPLTHPLTHPPTHPLTHSPTHPPTHVSIHQLSHSTILILGPTSLGGAPLTYYQEEPPPYPSKTTREPPGLAVCSPPHCYWRLRACSTVQQRVNSSRP